MLDTTTAGAFVAKLATMERLSLGTGYWSLVFSNTGAGCMAVCLLDDDTERMMDVVSEFKRELLVDEAGCLHIRMRSNSGATTTTDLLTMVCRHRLASMSLRVGRTSASWKFDLAVFLHGRTSGSRVFWPLVSVYEALGLTAWTYASRWVRRSIDRWLKKMSTCVGCTQDLIIPSTNANDSECAGVKQ